MRILVVFHDSNIKSGATASMIDLIDSWERCHSDLVIESVFPCPGSAASHLQKMGKKVYFCNYYSIRVPTKTKRLSKAMANVFAKNIIASFSNIVQILRFRKQQYDFVYSNTSDIYFGYYLARAIKVKHIWHIREYGVKDQDRVQFDGAIGLTRKLNKSAAIIAISKAIKEHLVFNGVNSDIVNIIYDDVGLDREAYKYKKNDYSKIKALSCGGIQENKGHLEAIKAIEKLIVQGIDAILLIAGETRVPYYNVLKEYVRQHKLENRVVFCGFINDMSQLRKECNIAIIGSYSEAFGRVTIEAMNSKMVVVGSNSGATPELIKDGETGYLFSLKDVDGIVNSILSIIKDTSKANTIVENAYRYAEQFCMGKAANMIYDLLKEGS